MQYTKFIIAGLSLFLLAACNAQPVQNISAATQDLGTESPTAIRTGTQTITRTNIPMNQNNGNADVVMVRAVQNSSGNWTFYVTVSHPDTGWEDYADGWNVTLEDGVILKPDPSSSFTRLLLHPHVGEQPFTRSQGNILIPDDVTTVIVQAHDLVDGFGGQEVILDLAQSSGENYTVERQ